MCARRASDAEVECWRDHGWVLIDGLVGTDEIDAVRDDVHQAFPTAEQYHADPEGETARRLGHPPPHHGFVWPNEGPGFRDDQHRWQASFPFAGSGGLNRLVVHPNLIDFIERALATTDLRIYQTGISAKYTGITNYEQPMHTDRNHSWLPAVAEAPWWHVEGFLYLSDVNATGNPTHLASVQDSIGRPTTTPLIMPDRDPEIYAHELGAVGVRGSFLAYRSDVFHRAVDLTEPGGSRFLLNVSFRTAGQDWIGYHNAQSRSTSPDWVRFVEGSRPRELELFGFPPPGHPIWTTGLIEATGTLYPKLDLSPWLSALND
ncbi:MAG TPA: hypothetical protein VNC61_04760 [Acidimicrobiales bacterium]|nr:hypothetical protein [Acidimicrobiales bacterium]